MLQCKGVATSVESYLDVADNYYFYFLRKLILQNWKSFIPFIFFLQIFFNKGAGTCNKVCTKSYDVNKPEDLAKLNFLKKGMGMNYQHHWIVDNMPVRDFFSAVGRVCPFNNEGSSLARWQWTYKLVRFVGNRLFFQRKNVQVFYLDMDCPPGVRLKPVVLTINILHSNIVNMCSSKLWRHLKSPFLQHLCS